VGRKGGRVRKGRESERGGDVEGPGKWPAPGPTLPLGGPAEGDGHVQAGLRVRENAEQETALL